MASIKPARSRGLGAPSARIEETLESRCFDASEFSQSALNEPLEVDG